MTDYQRSPRRAILRYTLIFTHLLLWLTIFLISLILTGNIVLLIIHCVAGAILAIYLPAAIILSFRNSSSKFSCAGAEVAYVNLQIAAFIASGTVAIIWRIIVGGNCDDEFYWNGAVYNISFVACNIFSVIAGLSFFNVALLCFWFGLLVRRARNTPGLYPRQAYGVPAHRLIVGDVNREGMYQPASLGGAFDVRAADAEMGMVNPFANTRQPVSVPRQSQMFAPPSGTPQRGAPLFARRETTEITSLTPPLNVKRWSDRSDAGSAVRLLAEQPEHRSLEESSRRSPNGSKAGSPEGLGHPTYGLP